MLSSSLTFESFDNPLVVSLGNGIGAVTTGLRILNFLYHQELTAYSSSNYSTEWFRMTEPPQDLINHHKFKELKLGFLSRMTSYVITIYNLDGIFLTLYEVILSLMDEVGHKELIPDHKKTIIADRAHEIKDYLLWRHKVFAHTSFAFPKQDSKSMQETSIVYYSGSLLYIGNNDFLSLGGGTIMARGDKPEDVPNFPTISIVGDYSKIMAHYDKWQKILILILSKLDKDELKSKTGISFSYKGAENGLDL